MKNEIKSDKRNKRKIQNLRQSYVYVRLLPYAYSKIVSSTTDGMAKRVKNDHLASKRERWGEGRIYKIIKLYIFLSARLVIAIASPRLNVLFFAEQQ